MNVIFKFRIDKTIHGIDKYKTEKAIYKSRFDKYKTMNAICRSMIDKTIFAIDEYKTDKVIYKSGVDKYKTRKI
jgi:hypothetical protein